MRFPETYAACRQAFLAAAETNGATIDRELLPAVGREGEPLTIDAARFGPADASRVVVLLSGVHGVEGPAGSAIQVDRMGACADAAASGDAVLLVHAVNPWGMSWQRRQNEGNVDLNRNWLSDDLDRANEAYAEIHDLVCPGGAVVPDADALVAALSRLTAERGLDWVRRAVSGGQYSHPEGLYFGGTQREGSTLALEALIDRHVLAPDELTIIDLHTGHGGYGDGTVLMPAAPDSDEGRWLTSTFDGERIESSTKEQGANVPKRGQLSVGIADRSPAALTRTATFEIGTRSETRMIVAEMLEHWVHQCGDRSDPAHAAIVDAHFRCSTPDDPEWHHAVVDHGRRVVTAALAAALEA